MAKKALGPASLALVQEITEASRRLPKNYRFVVAVSGGADSMALVLGLHHIYRGATGSKNSEGDVTASRIRAIVIDHGLQSDSAAVSNNVVATLASRGIAAKVLKVHVADTGQGIEAAARDARYRALLGDLAEDEILAIGHTMDDQAETVLLGLLRGSGPRSLSGMAELSGRLWRPLLKLRRSVTQQTCLELGIRVWDDPQNYQDRFTRVRVRSALIPALVQQLGDSVIPALARTATLCRDDADALDHQAEAVLDAAWPGGATNRVADLAGYCPVDCEELDQLPRAISSRVVRLWLRRLGVGEISYGQLTAVLSLVFDWHGQQQIDIPGARVERDSGRLRVFLNK